MGNMLYKTTWDIVEILHKVLSMNVTDTEEDDVDDFGIDKLDIGPKASLTASDVLHCLQELRNHIKKGSQLCEIYARYPELLPDLTLEKLLLGHEIMTRNNGIIQIPGFDPLLFNSLYYLTSNQKQESSFLECFPGWDCIFTEDYKDQNIDQYRRTLLLGFDILYSHNEKNCYPIHIMVNDLIANSAPTDLMDSLNIARKCASSSKYATFKDTMAMSIKTLKEHFRPEWTPWAITKSVTPRVLATSFHQ